MPVKPPNPDDLCAIPNCSGRVYTARLCLPCFQLARVVETPSEDDPDSIERAIERRRRLTPQEIADGCAEHEDRKAEMREQLRERDELEALWRLSVPCLSEADADWLADLGLDAQWDDDLGLEAA